MKPNQGQLGGHSTSPTRKTGATGGTPQGITLSGVILTNAQAAVEDMQEAIDNAQIDEKVKTELDLLQGWKDYPTFFQPSSAETSGYMGFYSPSVNIISLGN